MKQRYLKVKGKPGVAVSNPWTLGTNPVRFAGKRRDAALDGEPEHIDRYRDVEEILVSHNHLIDAAKAGDLEVLDKCEATNIDEAMAKMVLN